MFLNKLLQNFIKMCACLFRADIVVLESKVNALGQEKELFVRERNKLRFVSLLSFIQTSY